MLTSGVLLWDKMKLQLSDYSGLKIHPGHGKTMVRIDGKTYIFLNAKCAAAHLMKRNPCEAQWTDLYRSKHKKNMEELNTLKEVVKEKFRRGRKRRINEEIEIE